MKTKTVAGLKLAITEAEVHGRPPSFFLSAKICGQFFLRLFSLLKAHAPPKRKSRPRKMRAAFPVKLFGIEPRGCDLRKEGVTVGL